MCIRGDICGGCAIEDVLNWVRWAVRGFMLPRKSRGKDVESRKNPDGFLSWIARILIYIICGHDVAFGCCWPA